MQDWKESGKEGRKGGGKHLFDPFPFHDPPRFPPKLEDLISSSLSTAGSSNGVERMPVRIEALKSCEKTKDSDRKIKRNISTTRTSKNGNTWRDDNRYAPRQLRPLHSSSFSPFKSDPFKPVRRKSKGVRQGTIKLDDSPSIVSEFTDEEEEGLESRFFTRLARNDSLSTTDASCKGYVKQISNRDVMQYHTEYDGLLRSFDAKIQANIRKLNRL